MSPTANQATVLDEEYCELEVALTFVESNSYAAVLRFTQPQSDVDNRPSDQRVQIDPKLLAERAADPVAYGTLLSQMLFEGGVGEAYRNARTAAESKGQKLRVRLLLGVSASRLHALRWETITDPLDGGPLVMREDVVFSRYLDSRDWRPVAPVRKPSVRALVAVANPGDLASYAPSGRVLADVPVASELARARQGLGAIPCDELATRGTVSIGGIIARLREPAQNYEILYLVCHGALIDGKPHLYLEDGEGNTAVASGEDFVNRLHDMDRRPRLIVLASCESAGTGEQAGTSDDGALAALGPALAERGIPAVLAMQGDVTMRSIALFMPTFFRELERHGQIDRAVAAARGAIRERPDWWVPVLFMRLKSGMLWYERGFYAAKGGEYRRWDPLLADIQEGRCVMVVGPGLTEPLLGSTREIARRWADSYGFPMAAHEREDLPQVTQYLAYSRSRLFPMQALRNHLKREIAGNYRDQLPEALRDPADPKIKLDEMITAVGRKLREANDKDLHRLLASLPLRTYISACRDSLLEDALREAGRKPEVAICRWRENEGEDEEDWPKSVFEREQDYEPTEERPLIFQVFGNIRYPNSVVLTEDDYFDYLVGVTKNQQNPKTGIPPRVRKILAAYGLVFLGFHIDDWDFRVLFRGILRQPGMQRGSDHANVAVQIEPSEGRMLEPLRARDYLQEYFLKNRSIATYWGSAQDFVEQLVEQLNAHKGG